MKNILNWRTWSRAYWVTAVSLISLVAAIAGRGLLPADPVAPVDSEPLTLTDSTNQKRYSVSIRPELGEIPLAELHNWIIHIESTSGDTFIPEQLSLVGGMPMHGHGFSSQPKITRYLRSGDFLVEGMRFDMAGLWHVEVSVVGPAGPDKVRFELIVRNAGVASPVTTIDWSDEELRVINSLWIKSINKPKRDLSNRFSGNQTAAKLGESLFFERGLSATSKVSCADCHDPRKQFTDGKVRSFGSAQTARHSPSLLGLAHSDWFYWDGRRDSLWAQALTPIETPGEMDSTRVATLRYVVNHPAYGPAFSTLTNSAIGVVLDDMSHLPDGAGPYSDSDGKSQWQRLGRSDQEAINGAFADFGKIIAAYVETLQHGPGRFDDYVTSLMEAQSGSRPELLTEPEINGLKLFIDGDRAPCLRCHNGPLFTNHGFHNIGTGVAADGTSDWGRFLGLRAAMIDEFNCYGTYSDAQKEQCSILNFVAEGHMDNGAFKVPSLRNAASTPPYMHDGRFKELRQVIDFYRSLPPQSQAFHEIPPFEITDEEADQLVAFLGTLTGNTQAAKAIPGL